LPLDRLLLAGMQRLLAQPLELRELRARPLLLRLRHRPYSRSESRAVRLSVPALVLRVEGLLVLGAAVALYVDGDFPVWPLPAFILAPDLAFAAYLGGPRAGAAAYNLTHTYVVPVALAAGALLAGENGVTLQIALIWAAHIGGDRFLGYGLKYPTAFKDTHLRRV
jgi:hypothetical protein